MDIQSPKILMFFPTIYPTYVSFNGFKFQIVCYATLLCQNAALTTARRLPALCSIGNWSPCREEVRIGPTKGARALKLRWFQWISGMFIHTPSGNTWSVLQLLTHLHLNNLIDSYGLGFSIFFACPIVSYSTAKPFVRGGCDPKPPTKTVWWKENGAIMFETLISWAGLEKHASGSNHVFAGFRIPMNIMTMPLSKRSMLSRNECSSQPNDTGDAICTQIAHT